MLINSLSAVKGFVKTNTRSISIALLLGAGSAVAQEPLSAEAMTTAAQLRERGLTQSDAYRWVESLTVEVGPRLAGSEADARAVAWAKKQMATLKLDRVATEPVTLTGWQRGSASARVLAPYLHNLVVTALGGSVGTPAKGLKGTIVRFDSLAELQAADKGKVRDRIVFINQRMPRHITGSGYAAVVGNRTKGAVEAARKGAKAIVIRSVGTDHDRFAHTGSIKYEAEVKNIPAAALSAPDADLLEAMLGREKPVELELKLGAQILKQTRSYNVIGEIKGREKPEEVVLISAHLDSWDEGTGALDDGAGVAIVLETMRLLRELPQAPRRTVRVALFAAEEIGLVGSTQYIDAHKDELHNHVVALESDFGAGKVWRFDTRFAPQALGLADQIMQVLAPLDIARGNNEARGGPDVRAMANHGVPLVTLYQDGNDYFDYHHTPNDTLDKIDPDNLKQNVAAWAAFTYLAAEMEGSFGRVKAEQSP